MKILFASKHTTECAVRGNFAADAAETVKLIKYRLLTDLDHFEAVTIKTVNETRQRT